MKIPTKTILLILMVVILSFTLIACNQASVNPTPIDKDPDESSPVISFNKNQLMRKMSTGLTSGAERLENTDVKFVSTVYTIHTGYLNYTVEYKANYASKRQDSEIYAKIFDNNDHTNRVFIYYNKGDLFIQSQDEKHSLKEFGTSSMFDLFFETVILLDMSQTFISHSMSSLFDPENVAQNIGALIDQSRMRYIKVTDTAESIEMRDVNLNYGQIKQQVNDLIKHTFEPYENKFDLLSLKYLGFRISELAYLEVGTMNGDFINMRLDHNNVETIIFKASGDMADGINTFVLNLEVSARPGKGTIKIDDTENPYLNNYPEIIMGRYNYGGKLYVPFLDMTYDATLRTILSSTDNTENQVVFTLESVNEEMGGIFYKDQMLYIDINGLDKQLNGAVELHKLNLPRVKFDNIDLAQEITLLINDVLKIVQALTGDDDYGENQELMRIVLDNIVSNEKDKTISITITKDLIQKLYGEDVDLVKLISEKLGVAPELIAQIFGDDALQDARLILIYNVDNGDIGVDLYDGDKLVFELRLSKIPPLPGDTLTYPKSFDPDNFFWLEIPDNTILSLEGSLSMQQVSKVQFDQLFGALFGDITGLNTPYTLLSNEILNFYLDIMQVYDYQEDATGELQRTITQVMKFELYKANVLQLGVYSSADPKYLLVNFNFPVGPHGSDSSGIPYVQRTLKYRIEREKVKAAFDELLGEDNIFAMENVMDVLSRLLQSVSDSVSMQLRFIDSSLAFNLVSDTVNELIGIDNLNALLKARIRFAMTPEEYLNINIMESEYVTPNVRPLENQTFESIYTTQWQEFVYTYFGDHLMRLKLSYIEDSIAIISGKYFYQPRAKILDKIASYYVTIEDNINGIKVVQRVLDPDTPYNMNAVLNVDNPLRIDPSKDTELPEKIPVYYDDGTFGYVNYIIEGFDISNINVSGMQKAEYWLVIGKGSVAEKRYFIAVEVLGRIIIPIQEVIQGEVVYMISNLGVPVVDEITIDPYTYAIRKAENPYWTPLKTSLNLRFESVDGVETGDSITVYNINWDFDFNNIQYNGGVFFTHATYNRLPIALKINVMSKIVAYLRFVDKVNTNLPIDQRPFTEAIGQYTVDVLETSTYTFPTTSTSTQELRLYFEDGTYRIIGTREHSLDDNNFYREYLPLVLQWKHPSVNESSVRLIGTKAPLGIEDKNINRTVIGSDSFTIGNQNITLNILMPSRAEGTIGNAGTVFAITGYNKLLNGDYDFENPIREHSVYTNASFYLDRPLGTFYDFNPYNQQPLPNKVYLNVIQGGEYRYQTKGYNVQWIESDVLMARHTMDGAGNIIKTDYLLRNVSTDEELLLVRGILGDGNNKIEVRMIVRNIEAVYQDITFEGLGTNVTEKIIDPYLNYTLPSYYTLMLRNGNEILVQNVEWYIILIPGKDWMFQLNGRSYYWIFDYINALDSGLTPTIPAGYSTPTAQELNYYRLLIERGEVPIDNRFVFPHQAGSYQIKSYIEATESIIAQEVFLTLNVIPRNILKVDSNNNYTKIDIFNTSTSQAQEQFVLDTYLAESTDMLNRLDFLYRMNEEYDTTLRILNNILANIRQNNKGLDYISVHALGYDQYFMQISADERAYLSAFYENRFNQNPNADEKDLKYYALQDYIQQKNNQMNQIRVGLYFGDNPETSMQKYELIVRWINIEAVISALTSSSGAVLGIVLEGYIGYGQINQQLIRIPFRISRREVVNFNFNRLTGYDTSVMTIDYRYVYIGNDTEALSLINSIQTTVGQDNSIPEDQKPYTVYTRVYNHITTTDNDRSIMDSVEDSIQAGDEATRYTNIINELKRLRQENKSSVLIEMHKPLGLTQLDFYGDRVFIAPSDYFSHAFSQVSLMFADGTEGYYTPRFTLGNGSTLNQQKVNFDSRLLATNPAISHIEIDEITNKEYAYVNVLLTHLSAGSCEYPVTIRFKAIVDRKGVVGGEPSQSELEPFDSNGNPRFQQGYQLPDKVTIIYDYSGPVTFGNISNWRLTSPLYGFNEGDTLSVIPVTCINVLNPSIIDFSINLPCSQGEYSYRISFPEKYIGKTKYNATAEDRNFRALDINDGIIEINNIYEIYDPNEPLGFNITKLPQTIIPYNYAYGDVQFDLGGMTIDTSYMLTGNNSFNVQWRIVDDWLGGRKIDYNGTIINVNGQLQVGPVLFATAKIFSYYYYDINNYSQPILLEQEIELYIKVKPMLNPVIAYEGLITYGDNNYISFDPYNDPNNYGGNLSLPKGGLKVYFNNNLEDYHIFDSRAALNYYLLMDDTNDVVKSHLFDALISRTSTPNAERMVYQKQYINQLIQQYARAMNLSTSTASEAMLSIAFDAILESSNLSMSERARQRKFLADFTTSLLSQNYNISSLNAWNKLMTLKQNIQDRTPIVADYLYRFNSFTEDMIVQDIDLLLTGFTAMNSLIATSDRIAIVNMFYATLNNAQKANIIDILLSKNQHVQDINTAIEQINFEGVIIDEINKKAEALNRVIQALSVNSRLDIFRIYIQEDSATELLANRTGKSVEATANALLYRQLVISVSSRSDLINLIAESLASTIDSWDSAFDVSAAGIWDIHLNRTIERGVYENINYLIELYMSCSQNNSISRLKQIVVNRLLNIYDFNDEEVGNYFLEDGQTVATNLFAVMIFGITPQMAEWRINKAKAFVWNEVTAGLANDNILTRIMVGESDEYNTGRLNTQVIRALSYERLRRSSILPIFELDLNTLESQISNPDPEARRAEIFNQLYLSSTISKKVLLIEIMMGAAYNITDSMQSISVIPYSQAGHSIPQIDNKKLDLYLYLPDGQRIEIILDIFSREINTVLIPNVITNHDGVNTEVALPNIYYIDPYNSETFKLPERAEFVFETGHNLILDINEWIFEYEGVFYTRSNEELLHKIFYYKLSENSYRGGSYSLTSYLTYGTGSTAEKQYFPLTIIVLNRTLKEEYNSSYHFDNPIAGRMMDIPYLLTEDMFVDIDVYYKNVIPAQYHYSNFGRPVVPQINWSKTALNPDGITDSDIDVNGGFSKTIQGYLYYDNNLILNTYNKLWQLIYEEYSILTKPMAWEKFFDISIGGERIVKTIFAGLAAEQILFLDNQIYNELYIEAYLETNRPDANADLRGKIRNIMDTLRNNNFGLYPDDSQQWFIFFYKELERKAKNNTLTANETDVWVELYSTYVNLEIQKINIKRAQKWDQLMAMNGVLTTQQRNIARNYLDEAYLAYRNSMLITTWDSLERVARQSEAVVMAEIINTLSGIYGSIEQAKIRAWNILRFDDRVKGVNGEGAKVKITAKSWNFIDLVKEIDDELTVIKEIIFNAFTKSTQETSYEAIFEIINNILADRLDQILENLVYQYYDDYKADALEILKGILRDQVLEELDNINSSNPSLNGRDKWLLLISIRETEAASPIDDTRADVENSGVVDTSEPGYEYQRDVYVWTRLLEGAGSWHSTMLSILATIEQNPSILPSERYYYAVEEYRNRRIETFTEHMNSIYAEVYYQMSLNAWLAVETNYQYYGETQLSVDQILNRKVKEVAWERLKQLSPNEVSTMNPYVIATNYDLKFAKAWDNYYDDIKNINPQRRMLMDSLLKYYSGYIKASNQYSGYGAVLNDVLANPQVIGETEESILELFVHIASLYPQACHEFLAVEVIERLKSYKEAEINSIYSVYTDALRRNAWSFYVTKAYDDNNTDLLAKINLLITENSVMTSAWDKLYQNKESEVQVIHNIIEEIFDEIANEYIDRQLAKAFELYAEDTDIISIKENYNKDEVKTVLWYRLYEILNSSEKLAMESTLNNVVREGSIIGESAEARSWDRLSNKNEISQETKALMDEMYEVYLNARVFEQYREFYINRSVHYIDICVNAYRMSRVWDVLYLFFPVNHELRIMMENIYVIQTNRYPTYDESLIKAYALDELINVVEPEIAQVINEMVEAVEYTNISEINKLKADEWDNFYAAGSVARRTLMNSIYQHFINEGYSIIESKARALDTAQFRNEILTVSERDTLDQRLKQKKDDLLEILLHVNAFSYISSNSSHSSQINAIYSNILNRFNILYSEIIPNEDLLLMQAVKIYKKQLEDAAVAEMEEMLNNCLVELENEYNILTWDRYYQYCSAHKEETADLMEGILHDSVMNVISNLKIKAVEQLYEELIADSTDRIAKARESILNTIRKETIWEENFGEDLDSLKAILNAIFVINDDGLTLKNTAWQNMLSYLSGSEDEEEISMRATMVSVRTIVYGENTELTNAEINALAFDRIMNEYPSIAEVLVRDFVNEIKNQAWNELREYYQGNNLMQSLFDEMFNMEMLYHDNDEIISAAICWDRMVGMTVYIDQTLAGIDPRFSAAELRAFAIDCILDLLSGTESVVLLNAINNVNIALTEAEFDALVYDNIFRENNTLLKQMYASAGNDKALALQLYFDYLTNQAVKDIEDLATTLYNKAFSALNNSQKTQLFDALHEARVSERYVFHTLTAAKENWQNAMVDTEFGRMNIFWNEQALNDGGDIAPIYLGNAYKNYDIGSDQLNYSNNVFVGANYLYKTRQIHIDYLDFHGELNIWSGDDIIGSETYYNQLVIDPLNPVIPNTVDAYGIITGVTPNVNINGTMYTYIGKVAVSFENRIYEFLYDNTGELGENITAIVAPGLGEELQNVTIKVFYLDRRPIMYYVNSQNYTNEQRDENLMLYPLTHDNITGNKIITIDPLNESIFNQASQRYMLPNSLVVMFTDAYLEEVISTLFMNRIFQSRMDISNINWNLLGNTITLQGLSPTNIIISSYNVDGKQITSTADMGINFWNIQLKVETRTPERILSVNQQGLGGTILSSTSSGTMSAVNKIDPYNPMASFPTNVRVEFMGGSESKLITNVTWIFEEGRGLEFLQLAEVITGTIDQSAMYLTAGFKCVSQIIWINFPIQARHIDTSEGNLKGGTIYLIRGVNLQQQLARYSSLYYNFAEGQTTAWSEVPLEFSVNDMELIDIHRIGRYTLRGRLGPINDLNIEFDVEVVDPKLYATDLSGAINPKVYYDTLAVAVNTFGVRVNGKEDEQGFLPDSFVQFSVHDNNDNPIVGYNEFNIISRHWDVANKQVIFTCIYTFLTENDDLDKLAGNINGSRDLTFTTSIPLQTYLYTEIDETMQLQVNSGDGTSILKHNLGSNLLMSQLPKAIMNKGASNEVAVTLLWDLSSLNVNRAGTYNIYGYYRDYTSSYLTKSKNLVIVIDKIDITNEITTLHSLVQTYTGLNIEVIPVLPSVLRDNGTYTQLRLGRDIIVEYLTAEKYELGEFGDFRTAPFRNAGDYRVRITINDYNIKGQQVFNLKILPIEIDPKDIVFEYGEGASTISVQIPNWPQSYEEKDRLYYSQFRAMANQELGSNAANNARAAAYDALFNSLNSEGQTMLNNRFTVLLELTYPNYYSADETARANMRRVIKSMVWEEIVPTGLVNSRLVPHWPGNSIEKEDLLNNAKAQLEAEEVIYTENFAMARAYDNLYNVVMEIGRELLNQRLSAVILSRFPNYNEASEALKTSMLIEAKSIVWKDMLPTGFANAQLVPNWPVTAELKEQLLDAQYVHLLTISLTPNDRDSFIMRAKARAYDSLLLELYSTAQDKLTNTLNSVIQQYYPNYNNYDEFTKNIVMIECKAMVWDDLIPNDTVNEKSYVYNGNEHMPTVSGLPQAKIIGWPQTNDEKTALLNFAVNENINFTSDEAKARAFDNLMETVYSNIHALQKITNILNNVIVDHYPQYNNPGLSYEDKQQLLILAKSRAWDTRILIGDTVEEINYSFNYWYANMNNESMMIYSRPKDAGTYEITLIINPSLNQNYQLKGDEPIKTTISIRRALIDTTFVNQMVYRGRPISPICNGLHDANGNLPEGVTIDYTYMRNGQAVNSIKDVGQYTFTAVVNGGNNYPSWTVHDQVLNITPKDLVINVGTVEGNYLENLKPFNSSVTIEGIVGNDIPSMFGYLVCQSNVTNKHMVGDYPINFIGFKESFASDRIFYLNAGNPADDVMELNPILFHNYNITVINGTYRINKANPNAIIISSEEELNTRYEQLKDGDSVIWYLAPGNYGDLVIDKNVGITIIGCYDINITDIDYSHITDTHDRIMSQVKDDALSIVTFFNSITVNRGALTLDIIRIDGRLNQSIIYIGRNATSVDISRSAFVHTEIKGEGGASIPQNASALMTSPSFKGLLRLENTYVEGFTAGIYMSSGRKLEIVNCRFNKNRTAIRSFGGDIHIEGSRFEFSIDNALYLEMIEFTVINCSFMSNAVAVRSMSVNTYDIWLENRFSNNVKDTERL